MIEPRGKTCAKLQQKIRVGNPFSYLFVFFFSDLALAAPFFENRFKNEKCLNYKYKLS